MLKRGIMLMMMLAVFFQAFGPDIAYAQSANLKKAEALRKEVRRMYKEGRYSEAIPLALKALAIEERELGPENVTVANSKNNLGELYRKSGDYSRAEPMYKQALAVYEKVLGPKHNNVAITLNNLGMLYQSLGKFSQAEGLHKRALAIYKKVKGPESAQVANTINNLAILYKTQGKYDKAISMYEQAAAITKKTIGSEHPHYAIIIKNLASAYAFTGAPDKAEPLFHQALAIRKKVLRPNHPQIGESLYYLGNFYHERGDFKRAEPYYIDSLKIYEKSLGSNHPATAGGYSGLASLYRSMGSFDKAEEMYKKGLKIKEKALGPNHLNVAADLNSLALFYHQLGDLASSEKYFKRALSIYEKSLPANHPSTAATINNMASLYSSMGKYRQAEAFYLRALAMVEKSLGPDSEEAAATYHNLAALYFTVGETKKAVPLYEKALAFAEKNLGPEHPHTATILGNLGMLYLEIGDYNLSEKYLKRSLSINKKIHGTRRPATASALHSLGLLYAAKNNNPKAHFYFKQARELDAELIDQVLSFTSEERKMIFLATKQSRLEISMCLAASKLKDDRRVRIDALNWWLRRKGIILEAQKRFQEALIHSNDPQVIQAVQELGRVRAELSKLVFSGPGKEGPDKYKKRIAELEEQKRALEDKLVKLSKSFARQKKAAAADVKTVANALPKGSALIEFARVRYYDFKAKGHVDRYRPAHYLAFVVHAGKGSKPSLIDLGVEEPINQAVASLKKNISNIKAANKTRAASQHLYELVFAPIKKQLGDAKNIFISPDGDLNLIPFEIIQNNKGKYLIEDYTFNYLASGRDAAGFGYLRGKAGKSMLFGDPDFNLSKSSRVAENISSGRSADLRSINFGRLPGTLKEVNEINKIIGPGRSIVKTGRKATESALFSVNSPRILHLATHGFFLTDQQLDALRDDPAKGGRSPEAEAVKVENPLLRSGLALAGANRTLRSKDANRSSGLLTAEKVLSLKLTGTDLVVLSACETGLGEVRNGEGVYGLRRAFVQAGTKGLVMSMWSVPDNETMELMTGFYTNLVIKKMNPNNALRQAALAEMNIVKNRYGHAHPLYWGAFIYLGEPGVGGFKAGRASTTSSAGASSQNRNASTDANDQTGLTETAKSVFKPLQKACFVTSTE